MKRVFYRGVNKLFSIFTSKRYTHLLLALSICWSLLFMYGGASLYNLAWWGMNLTLASLAVSIISCSVARCKALLIQQGRKKGLLGSVVFHLGLLVMLVGFLVNLLWSYQGVIFLPEGEPVQVPTEYRVQKRGVLATTTPDLKVMLVKLDNTMQVDNLGNTVSRPKANLHFWQGSAEEQHEVEVNYPAYFQGLYWQQLSWGYSLLLTITSPTGVVVKDYVNIATHTGTNGTELKFYDIVPVSSVLKLDIRYYPETAGSSPNHPQMQLKILTNEQILGQAAIPLGSSGKIGSYNIKFEQVRNWQAMDVGYDPGRYWLYLGGLLAVGGLLGTTGKYRAWGSEEKTS